MLNYSKIVLGEGILANEQIHTNNFELFDFNNIKNLYAVGSLLLANILSSKTQTFDVTRERKTR